MNYILLYLLIKTIVGTQVIINTAQAYNFYGRTIRFSPIPKTYCCDNIYRYTLLQGYIQNKQVPYQIIISLPGPYNISISMLEGDTDDLSPSLSASSCRDNCTVLASNNCQRRNGYAQVQVNITGLLPLTYNIFCNNSVINSPFQYGLLVLIIVCFVQIILAAHFQTANAFDNRGIYVQFKIYAGLCVCFIVGSLLIIFFANTHKQQTQLVFEVLSFILGIFSIMVCVSEFIYWTGIQCLRCEISYKRVVIRFMDVFGLAVGTYVLISWVQLDKNWIISDVIYTAMFFTLIKLVKFGSLKMAILVFVSIFIIFTMFIVTDTQLTHSYFNNNILQYLNSPFFILFPTINFIPNQQCAWFFITSIGYPAMVLSYLVRFDYSRSTKVYTISFIFLFAICTGVWIVIAIFSPFVLPFDLIISVIYMAIIMLFANRRGQLGPLWHGYIYDAMHKDREQHESQIKQIIDEDKKVRYSDRWLQVKLSNISHAETLMFRTTQFNRFRSQTRSNIATSSNTANDEL